MKNFKIAAIVMAAALLVIGASMTAYAGWNNLGNGDYTYTNSDGDLVTNTWKKDGTQWFYLDDDGYMARDTMIEEDGAKKYVDDNGAMVTNDWRWYQGEDEEDGFWYYFASSGKAQTGKKTIDGKTYFFDTTGKMLSGWIEVEYVDNDPKKGIEEYKEAEDEDEDEYVDPYNKAIYFCGEDGAMVTGWVEVDYNDGKEYKTGWVYLGSNGKKVDSATKKINGQTYAFDGEGLMKSGWVWLEVGKDGGTSIYNQFYFGSADDGSKKTGWFWAKSNIETEDSVDDDDGLKYHWYYANKTTGIVRNELKKINGKYYAFDNSGIMLSGLYELNVNDGKILGINGINYADLDDETATPSYKDKVKNEIPTSEILKVDNDTCPVYFFGEEETDGAMKTGTLDVTTTGDDGKTYSMTFEAKTEAKGQAYNGLYKKALYAFGVKVKASEEDKIVIYEAKKNAKGDDIWKKVTARDIIGTGAKEVDPTNAGENYDLKEDETPKYKGVVIEKEDQKNYIVITSAGSRVTTATTKTDGDDYKVKTVAGGDVVLVYYEI